MPNSNWSPEDDALLLELINSAQSSTVASIRLGRSRNSVIGRAQRTGMPRFHGGANQFTVTKPKDRSKSRRSHKKGAGKTGFNAFLSSSRLEPVARLEPSQPAGAGPASRGLDVLQLGPTDCRWPEGERVPYRFCGAEKTAQGSYCAHHTKMAWRP